ncbi:MAG: nitrate/nitrite transporter [Hyphomicrobiales bacterium]
MLSNRWSILALLFAVRTGMGIQYEAVAALSPLFMADFSLNIADIGLLIGLYHAPGTVLAFPGGAIGARLGDKRVVLIGLALMISGELMMALAPAWSMQIAGRFLAGSGGILLNVVMTKMVADWFAGKEIATAMAIFGNSAIFGIALALVALPFIAGAGGRISASCAVGAYLIFALFALAYLYRTPPHSGSVASGQSIWPDRRALWAVLAAGLIYGLWNASLVAVIGFGPLMLTERGWTIAAAGSATSVVLWLVALSLPGGGFLADRTGRGSTILVGGLIGFAGALVLSSRVDGVMPAFILLGIVGGLPCGPIMSLPAQVLAPQTRSVGTGIFFTVYYFLQVSCPWLVGELAKMAGSPRVAFDVGAVFLCIGALGWVVFRQLTNGLITENYVKVLS